MFWYIESCFIPGLLKVRHVNQMPIHKLGGGRTCVPEYTSVTLLSIAFCSTENCFSQRDLKEENSTLIYVLVWALYFMADWQFHCQWHWYLTLQRIMLKSLYRLTYWPCAVLNLRCRNWTESWFTHTAHVSCQIYSTSLAVQTLIVIILQYFDYIKQVCLINMGRRGKIRRSIHCHA